LIFVTVGGMRAFERLVIAMDRVAGELDEEVVIQTGSTDYEPENCKYFKFMAADEMEELYASTRVVVCHAGIGTILTAMQHNKPLILVPRMKRYGEHIDDHQLEIAREMESRGATVVYDVNDLKSAVEDVNMMSIKFESETTLISRLKEYLDRMSK
jgi:beta-1,4-N-acetylglucosaminyltransferase